MESEGVQDAAAHQGVFGKGRIEGFITRRSAGISGAFLPRTAADRRACGGACPFMRRSIPTTRDLTEVTMLKDYEIDKPILETDRLIIRTLNDNDVADLKSGLGERKSIHIGEEKQARARKILNLCLLIPALG